MAAGLWDGKHAEKRRKRVISGILSGCLCAMLTLAGFGFPKAVLAAERIDPEQECSLTLDYHDGNGQAFSRAEFSLYRVAKVSVWGGFSATEEYAPYRVSLNGLDQGGWRDAAQTLAGYVKAGGHTPMRTGITDEKGILRFEGLSTGLYLVTGTSKRYGNLYYNPSPQLISLPVQEDGGSYLYDVEATAKWGRTEGTDREFRVQKVWVNDSASRRPTSLTVELYRDEALYDTVELNSENNWRYTWTGLSDAYGWSVVEKEVPVWYTVTSIQDEKGFVLTNTYHKPGGGGGGGNSGGGGGNPPGTTTTGIPDGGVPLSDGPGVLDILVPMDSPQVPLAFLPQTGMLWWPVPVLMCVGLFLFLAGTYQRKAGEKDAQK